MARLSRLQAAEARLKASQDRARRRAMGKPLNWTEEQLAQLATVTDADKESAAAYWRRNAPSWARGLIDAEPVESDG